MAIHIHLGHGNSASVRRRDADTRDAVKYGQEIPRAVIERMARQGELELEGDLPSRRGATVQVRLPSGKRTMIVVGD